MREITKKNFYNFTYNNDASDLYLYGAVGEYLDGMGAKDFKDSLDKCKGKHLNVHISSEGGSVFEGNTIANLIKAHDCTTTAIIEGLCASIATQIALACNNVKIYKNSLFMIHRASTFCWGNVNDLKKQIDDLEVIDNVLAEIYVDITGLSKEEIIDYMDKETWFTAQQCLDLKFAHEIIEESKMVAKADLKILQNYKNTPKNLLENKIDIEKLDNLIKNNEIFIALNK